MGEVRSENQPESSFIGKYNIYLREDWLGVIFMQKHVKALQ